MKENEFVVIPATEQHIEYATQICDEMAESAKARGTGIAKRTPEYITSKMLEGKAVIALHKDGSWLVSVILKPGVMVLLWLIQVSS